jgi:hypothetical protein
MWHYIAKIAISAIVVVAVSEIAKRSSTWAAALASLPLTSLLAFVWLHLETGDTERVAALSHGIFWLVLPSLVLFLAFPALLRMGWSFWPSLAAASVATAVAYWAMIWALTKAGIKV